MRSGDPRKRGWHVDYAGTVAFFDRVDIARFDDSGGVGLSLDQDQFRLWQEERRNEGKPAFEVADAAICDLAQNALRVCLSRRLPQGFKWRAETTEEGARIVVTTLTGVELAFADCSFGLLLFRIESTDWRAVRAPDLPAPAPAPLSPEQARKIDAFERARAEILAKRMAAEGKS